MPRLPGARFRGATALGARGDVIAEMDWCVGQVLDALARLKLRERTIVLFTSDNGPVLDDGYDDEAVRRCGDHRPAGPLRGGKYSMYDGGTRVPFLLSWPGTVPVRQSAAMVSQVDLLASCAAPFTLAFGDAALAYAGVYFAVSVALTYTLGVIVAFKQLVSFPDDPEKGRLFPIDHPLTFAKLASTGFDPNAEVLLALEVIASGTNRRP